jgi:undecaprenyl diphosphate synthase
MMSQQVLDSGLEGAVPVHVGIIMDGNGRWAVKRNLPRTAGHKEGLTAAKRVVKLAADMGIRYVTLYTFSTENWKRAAEEVGFLMNLIMTHLRAEFEFYKQNGIRILHIGDARALPQAVSKEIQNAVKETAHFTGLTVVLAVNYGARDELTRAANKMIAHNENGNEKKQIFTQDDFASFFDVPALPDVDLVIRTGGEKRISNFLLWQAAYSEFVFSDTLWPDYSHEEFSLSIDEYKKRNRRFGGAL